MLYLYDYHIHSTNSIDGNNSIMEICESAVKNGLKEIAVTDHFEPSIGDESCRSYNQKNYWAEMLRARQAYRGKLKIKLGVELGQPHIFREEAEAILKGFHYDYIIASAHKLPSGLDVSQLDYEAIRPEDLCEMYIGQLKELTAWGDFDCIGHLDLIKRYSTSVYGRPISLTLQHDMLIELFKLVIQNNKGIEINTSGLRQSPKETMPGLDVLAIYRQLGGEILTLGSDAHFAADVGRSIADALLLAQQAGFRYVTTFTQRKPEWKKISTDSSIIGFNVNHA
ncbi:MAG: histidinol-phosphatase HisJ family protein [Bacillota bacterium]